MFFGGALIVGGWGVVGWGIKSYLGPAGILSSSCRDFSRSNKHDTFWHVVWTGYFYVLFLWAIAVPDFCPLEIYKNLGLPLSSITFKVNSHAGNQYYKYIYLFQTLWSMKWAFFIKIHVKVFYIQIWLKCKTTLSFFLIKTMVYRKNSFWKKNISFFFFFFFFCCRLCKNYWITYCTRLTSHGQMK